MATVSGCHGTTRAAAAGVEFERWSLGTRLKYMATIRKINVVNRTLLVIVTFLMCVGCQMDKRFSQLQTGMTKAQVLKIVGKRPTGDKTQDGTEILQWETGSHSAKFKNGRLIDYGTE